MPNSGLYNLDPEKVRQLQQGMGLPAPQASPTPPPQAAPVAADPMEQQRQAKLAALRALMGT